MNDIFGAGNDLSPRELAEALHYTFGASDLDVARRQMRAATGEMLARWSEVVALLEQHPHRPLCPRHETL